MIRPEAMAQLMRWREVLIGAAALTLGVWWLVGPGRLLALPAIALIVTGAALVWIGIQRARFRSSGQGPGSVRVDEGQITYYGPLTGGMVALRELDSLTLDPTQHPAHWRLQQPGQPPLLIPVNAEGAEALFDAFSTLPGFRTAKALSAIRDAPKQPVVIWQRRHSISAHHTLH